MHNGRFGRRGQGPFIEGRADLHVPDLCSEEPYLPSLINAVEHFIPEAAVSKMSQTQSKAQYWNKFITAINLPFLLHFLNEIAQRPFSLALIPEVMEAVEAAEVVETVRHSAGRSWRRHCSRRD